MKVLNIVLSIVILILAAISAVSSYLLLEKRTQLTDGWNKMATAINKASAAIDRESGTRVAADLSVASLSHEQYAQLDGQLNKFNAQVRKLVEQRNALAEAVRVNGVATELRNLPDAADFSKQGTYEASKDYVAKGVGDFAKRRNQLVAMLGSTANRLDLQLNAQELKDSPATGYRPFDTRINALRAQFEAYNAALGNIVTIVNADAEQPDLSDENYANALVEITNAVRNLKADNNKARSLLEDINNKYRAMQEEVKQRDGKIDVLNSQIAGKMDEISQYRRALGLSDENFKPWAVGSPESRRAVRGKVTEVNDKFGFIAVNLGTNTLVKQNASDGKFLEINPSLTKGMELCIARDFDDSRNVEFIGKVKLTTVDSDCSIAEVESLSPNQKIRVGDDVYIDAGYPADPNANK